MVIRDRPGLAKEGRARVLFDGHCAFCQRSIRLLKKLDWLKLLAYVDVRDKELLAAQNIQIDSERLLKEMHLIPPQGQKTYHGFGALRWMAWRLPALWFVAPLLYVPGVPQLGQKAYLWVARNRFQLVPCHGGVCTLPQLGRDAAPPHRGEPSN